MSPEQFFQRIRKGPPAPVSLFLGPELYQLGICRRALVEKFLAPEDRENGLSRHDMETSSLAAILDDARSLSLFAPQRVIWVTGAEAALPRGRSASQEENAGAADLADYVRNPTPGTVLIFVSSRYDFEGEERAKLERVQKFFACIPEVVEFRPYTVESARQLAQSLASEARLQLGLSEVGLLVDSLAADASRIVNEIEKLSLYVGAQRKVTADDILQLVPNAQATTIFALVAAIGRGDRKRSLSHLDTLLREGEYLPLALTFLATQFRLAMVAHEAGLRTAQQIQGHFAKLGIRIWRDRAEQVHQTVSAFSAARLSRAIEKVSYADRALRDARPDDRVVMEELVFSLTA
ncbi:MAG TPA: DNA polymerase III subunit delta [Bryobacteraceae bacterium]|jgi:DNA polymerase-3 subunit delta|nr:DNA polymerase III subunit delta [Bryobacteraceae bacterium]